MGPGTTGLLALVSLAQVKGTNSTGWAISGKGVQGHCLVRVQKASVTQGSNTNGLTVLLLRCLSKRREVVLEQTMIQA